MSIFFRIALVVLTMGLPLLSGCISTYDREAAEARFDQITLDDVSQKRSVINMPIKAAVYIDMETMDTKGDFEETWDWGKGDRKLVMSYLDNLEEMGYISDYFVIPDNGSFSMQDINYLIGEAAKQDADVLLTLRGVIWIISYLNPAAMFNVTILGAWLVPGSNRDAVLQVRMDLWNVREKDCILTVRGEGMTKLSRPTFLIETEDAVNQVKSDTLHKVLPEFKKRCREIKPAK